ncbi:MAG: DUF3109 family protein [Chitinophagales bacterium]
MIAIDDKLISEEIKDRKFVCNLAACKGACCIEGDSGAPLEFDELDVMEDIYEKVMPYLTDEGKKVIEEQGHFILDDEGAFKTPLVENKACAYVIYEKNGLTSCGIEKAYLDKKIDFKKPISCHLYPIRVTKYDDFEAVNYEEWDICKAACTHGENLKVPVYKFLKEPLTRKYGQEFYTVLEQVIAQMEKEGF